MSRTQLIFLPLILVILLAVVRPRLVFLLVLVWLPFMAYVRRWLYQYSSYESLDPVLIVGPLLLGVLTIVSLQRAGRVATQTPAGRCTSLLLALCVVQIFNPLQGGLLVGIAGAMFFVPPLSAFYLGKLYLDSPWGRRMLWGWMAIGVVAMVVGQRQVFSGWLPYEQYWIKYGGYAALNIGGIVRSLGTFNSGSEFSCFESAGTVAAIAWVVLGRDRWRWIIGLPAVAATLWGTILAGSTTGIFRVLIPALLLPASSRSGRVGRIGLVSVALLTGLFLWISRSEFEKGNLKGFPVIGGMLDTMASKFFYPLDEKRSTGMGHLNSPLITLKNILIWPLGEGLGRATMAAEKMRSPGSNDSDSAAERLSMATEWDVGNVTTATGLAGGILYMAMLYHLLRQACQLCRRTQDPWHWAAYGLLFSQLGQILMNHYAVPVLYFAVAGWTEAEVLRERSRTSLSARPGPAQIGRESFVKGSGVTGGSLVPSIR